MTVATPEAVARAAAEAANAALARAALVHRFDPLALISAAAGPDVEARALALLARDATETDWPDPQAPGQVETLWRLTPEARRRELRKLRDAGRLEAALQEAAAAAGDTFAKHLQRALQGRTDPGSVAPEERESAAAAARFAADVTDVSRPGKTTAAVHELRTALTETALEQSASKSLPRRLVGRGSERAMLEAFAATGAIAPSDRLPAADRRAILVPAYFLGGPHGAGKSALLADVVSRWRFYRMPVPAPASWTNWREVADFATEFVDSLARRAIFAARRLADRMRGRPGSGRIVVLDLGRLAMAIGGEIEWTADVTRQIGIGAPELTRHCAALREQIRANRMALDPSGKSVTALHAASADLKQGLTELVGPELAAGLPLVVVLDTFEEAVARSFPAAEADLDESLFGRVLHWADSLATLEISSGAPLFGAVRVVAAGCAQPPLEAAGLARWFVARSEIAPVEVPGVAVQAETLHADVPAASRQQPALARYQRVGPMRLHADEVAQLPEPLRDDALTSRLEFARAQGVRLRAPADLAGLDDGATSFRDAGEIGRSPDHLFAFLREREIGARIDYAFTFAEFSTAAAIGWRRIGTITQFPDLSEPWRLPGDPAAHWIWQTALAALALEDASAARARLEDFLGAFARALVDPSRAGADATGLVLAAAATVALDGRIPAEVGALTGVLAEAADALATVRTFADLRLLALAPLWRDPSAAAPRRVTIPYRRLRLFSESLRTEPPAALRLGGFERLAAFVADARLEAPTAREIDAFAIGDGRALEVMLATDADQHARLADILVGLSPELHDLVVVAAIEADRLASAAIDQAIEATRARAPFWPRDLAIAPVPVRERDRRAGLVARTVIHADRCGLLCAFVESLAERVDGDRLRDIARLVQRYEALRRSGFGAATTGRGAAAAPDAEPRGR